MKPTGQRWHLHDQHQLNGFTEWINGQWEAGRKPTVQVMGADRTSNQNAMINALYGDIARQAQDQSVLDVRRHCKLHYGIGILKGANSNFSIWYDSAIKGLNYEDKLLLMTYMEVTSLFNKAQATEYIDTIIREYQKQGFNLAQPEI